MLKAFLMSNAASDRLGAPSRATQDGAYRCSPTYRAEYNPTLTWSGNDQAEYGVIVRASRDPRGLPQLFSKAAIRCRAV